MGAPPCPDVIVKNFDYSDIIANADSSTPENSASLVGAPIAGCVLVRPEKAVQC